MTTTLVPKAPRSTVAAQARDVVKVYGRGEAAVRALDGATLSIRSGQFTVVMGPSGSGKSTLMHALAAPRPTGAHPARHRPRGHLRDR